ncbi:MAG: DUF4164 family protein [Alphaproteobacteria bacterium]
MSDLTSAMARFDVALQALETALQPVLEPRAGDDAFAPDESLDRLETELDALKDDRARLENDLGSMRAEMALLEVFTDQIFEKVDNVIVEIRDILEE